MRTLMKSLAVLAVFGIMASCTAAVTLPALTAYAAYHLSR